MKKYTLKDFAEQIIRENDNAKTAKILKVLYDRIYDSEDLKHDKL